MVPPGATNNKFIYFNLATTWEQNNVGRSLILTQQQAFLQPQDLSLLKYWFRVISEIYFHIFI